MFLKKQFPLPEHTYPNNSVISAFQPENLSVLDIVRFCLLLTKDRLPSVFIWGLPPDSYWGQTIKSGRQTQSFMWKARIIRILSPLLVLEWSQTPPILCQPLLQEPRQFSTLHYVNISHIFSKTVVY